MELLMENRYFKQTRIRGYIRKPRPILIYLAYQIFHLSRIDTFTRFYFPNVLKCFSQALLLFLHGLCLCIKLEDVVYLK